MTVAESQNIELEGQLQLAAAQYKRKMETLNLQFSEQAAQLDDRFAAQYQSLREERAG